MRIRVAMLVFCFLTLGIGSTVWAQDCFDDITPVRVEFESNFHGPDTSQALHDEIEFVISQAVDACQTGDEEAVAELVSQAKALMGMD